MTSRKKTATHAASLLLVLALLPAAVLAQDTKDYFRQNCKSCHTIGGVRLTGPDLKNVTQRQQRDWLVNFIQNPKAVIDSGDAYAQKLFQEAGRVPMPTPPRINRERAESLLDLIEEESAKEESEFKGIQISNEPFTDQNVDSGRAIFMGRQRLQEGGSACVSCHSIHDVRALGGGRLGPDLTNVYDKLKGRVPLANWLSAPGTETMQPIFKNHPMKAEEIYSLVAYLENAAKQRESDPVGGRVMFLLLGLAAAAGLMFAFDAVWKWRFRGVREPLVEAGRLHRA